MEVSIGVSNRHCHLTEEVKDILFGNNYILNKKNDLIQKGQYACMETITIKTNKNCIENVRIIGPCRKYTQIEISKTDSYTLGINPPLRNSGLLDNSETVTLIGPKGEYTAFNSTIIASRHIHVDEEYGNKYDLKEGDRVKAFIKGEKGGVLENIKVRRDETCIWEIHLDTDDANAFFIKNKDIVNIEKY